MKKIFLAAAALLLISISAYPQKFALKLGGGVNAASGSDFNRGVQGQMNYLSDQYTLGGGYRFPHLGINAAGELIYHPRGDIGIGIGFGYMRHAEDDTVSYAIGDVSVKEQLKPSFVVVPISLNLHFFRPLSSRLTLDLTAGGVYYLTKLDWSYRMSLGVLGLTGVDDYSFQATAGGFGIQAGLGLQWALSARVALCADFVGRLAPASFLGKFQGQWTEKGSGDLWNYSDSGTDQAAWVYDWSSGGRTYAQIAFQNETPSGSTVSNARYAKFGLSGFGMTLGLRIGIGN